MFSNLCSLRKHHIILWRLCFWLRIICKHLSLKCTRKLQLLALSSVLLLRHSSILQWAWLSGIVLHLLRGCNLLLRLLVFNIILIKLWWWQHILNLFCLDIILHPWSILSRINLVLRNNLFLLLLLLLAPSHQHIHVAQAISLLFCWIVILIQLQTLNWSASKLSCFPWKLALNSTDLSFLQIHLLKVISSPSKIRLT